MVSWFESVSTELCAKIKKKFSGENEKKLFSRPHIHLQAVDLLLQRCVPGGHAVAEEGEPEQGGGRKEEGHGEGKVGLRTETREI